MGRTGGMPDPIKYARGHFQRMLGIDRGFKLLPHLFHRNVGEAQEFLRKRQDVVVKHLPLAFLQPRLKSIRMDDRRQPGLRDAELPGNLRKGDKRIGDEEI